MSPAGGGAGSRRGQDVARPAHRRACCEPQSNRVEMTDPNAGEAEQRDAQQREQRPHPRRLASADNDGKCKRARASTVTATLSGIRVSEL